MKKLLIIISLITSIASYSQETWSLERCINYASDNSINVLRQRNENRVFSQDKLAAKGNYYPDLVFLGSQGFSLGNSFNVSTGVGQRESRFNSFNLGSSLKLFEGFSNKYKLERVNLIIDKGDLDMEGIKQELSIDITNKYFQVLFNKEILSLAQKQVAISFNILERIRKLDSQGLRPKNELLQIEAVYNLDKKTITLAENVLKTSLIELKTMMNIEDLESFDIEAINIETFEDIALPSDLNSIILEALNNDPYLKVSKLLIAIKEKELKISKTLHYPRLGFNYSYTSNYYHIQGTNDLVLNQESGAYEKNGFYKQLSNNRTHFLGFTLNIPIFNRYITKTSVAKSKIELEASHLELDNKRKELRKRINLVYNDMSSAKTALKHTEQALNLQKQAFEISQKKYEEGMLTVYEFLDNKSSYIQIQSEMVNSKYEYFFKTKVLKYLVN